MNPHLLDLTVADESASSDAVELVLRFAALLGSGCFEGGDFDGGVFSA